MWSGIIFLAIYSFKPILSSDLSGLYRGRLLSFHEPPRTVEEATGKFFCCVPFHSKSAFGFSSFSFFIGQNNDKGGQRIIDDDDDGLPVFDSRRRWRGARGVLSTVSSGR